MATFCDKPNFKVSPMFVINPLWKSLCDGYIIKLYSHPPNHIHIRLRCPILQIVQVKKHISNYLSMLVQFVYIEKHISNYRSILHLWLSIYGSQLVWQWIWMKQSQRIKSNIPSWSHIIIPLYVHTFNPTISLPSALWTKDLSMVHIANNLNSIKYADRLTISHLKKIPVCFSSSPCPSCIYRTYDL